MDIHFKPTNKLNLLPADIINIVLNQQGPIHKTPNTFWLFVNARSHGLCQFPHLAS